MGNKTILEVKMNSNFGLQEEFDVELKQSDLINELTFKGVMEVVHKREDEILSIDTGENVITNAGKAELVKLMGKLVTSDATPTGDQPMAFQYIGIGRMGSQSASATDTMLGGSLTNSFTKADLIDATDIAGTNDNYYVSLLGTSGFEYNRAFVKDADGGGTLVAPRTAGNTTGTATTSTTTSKNFYHAVNTTTIDDDTFLWYGKFIFGNIAGGTNVYVPTASGTTVTVNEAGIFNRPHAYGVATADPMPVMLARRTFSDKPVKNNDELTIKWQITIK